MMAPQMMQQQQQMPSVVIKNRAVQGSEQARTETIISSLTAGAQLLPLVRSSFGPNAKHKMLLIPTGDIVFTTDGHAFCRDLHPDHMAADLVVQGSRAQDEEVGDGTTSVVAFTSSLLEQLIPIVASPGMHPAFLSRSLKFAKDYLIGLLDEMAIKVDVEASPKDLLKIMASTINTKQTGELNDLICNISLKAMRIITGNDFSQNQNIDIKNNIRIMQMMGGNVNETQLIEGVVLEKDLLHSAMRRKIVNPRILIIEGGLEYKKGESQTTIELADNKACNDFLAAEEEDIKEKVQRILALKPDVVLTDKGMSEMASYLLSQNKVTAFRRCKKTDLMRLSLASGAKIVSVNEDFNESIVGTNCGLYETRKNGKEFFSYFEQCKNAKACTILIRGTVKGMMAEIGRNFQDALYTARSLILNPKILPGAGAIEMQMSQRIHDHLASSKIARPLDQQVLKAFTKVLEIIPITLLENAGVTDVARAMLKIKLELRDKKGVSFGINGRTGEMIKSVGLDVWDTYTVKLQCIKTAIETAILLISIDEIVAVSAKKKGPKMAQ